MFVPAVFTWCIDETCQKYWPRVIIQHKPYRSTSLSCISQTYKTSQPISKDFLITLQDTRLSPLFLRLLVYRFCLLLSFFPHISTLILSVFPSHSFLYTLSFSFCLYLYSFCFHYFQSFSESIYLSIYLSIYVCIYIIVTQEKRHILKIFYYSNILKMMSDNGVIFSSMKTEGLLCGPRFLGESYFLIILNFW